ncbi:MAG: hypothetical protein MZV70_17290 [Desulfobacterales bacterium]|nr:hypothetical protein [Desulfobacterales bacterium]
MDILPALTVVAKMAPMAIKAPARMARTNIFRTLRLALTPISSALAAIAAGIKASTLITGVSILILFSSFYDLVKLSAPEYLGVFFIASA